MTSGSQIALLNDLLLDAGLGFSFSHVKWDQIAPRLDIEPQFGLERVPYFDLQRAYLPEYIFKRIREDISVRMVAYGYIGQHKNEEATSRVMAPVSKLYRLS